MSGPCLSSSVADRPLRPATRLRLGGPLPRQLADRPQAPPKTPSQALVQLTCVNRPHQVLIRVSPFLIHVLLRFCSRSTCMS